MSDTPVIPDEAAVLRRLLELAIGRRPEALWERLDPGLRFPARAAYFLLDVEPGRDAESFVTGTLDRLLRQLSRTREQRLVEQRGRVRGPVLWQATLKARNVGDYDPTRFVCREVRRQYDTPENQLLRYVVERIAECLHAIPAALRAGVCYLPSPDGRVPLGVQDRLGRIEATVHRARHNARLRDVTLPPAIVEAHLLRAETARDEEYGEVARIYRRYRAAVEAPTWEGAAAIGQRVVLLPPRAGPDEEPWIRLGAAMLRG